MYEELCADPPRVVGQLMESLGETPEPAQLAFNARPHQEGLEDPEVASTDGVHTRSVGRWRSLLSEEAAALVWERTGDLWSRIDPEGRYAPPLVRGSN